MLTTRKGITAKLMGIAGKKYRKIIGNIQEKRNRKQKTQLQAALMLGSVRRVK
jgi:hypothetical protein